jgi:hypothetical protein
MKIVTVTTGYTRNVTNAVSQNDNPKYFDAPQRRMKMAIKREDVTTDGRISLVKLTGKPIKDIVGRISNEWGSTFFQVFKVVFEDGSILFMEGEHDCPYLPATNQQPNMDEETLESLREKEGEDDE